MIQAICSDFRHMFCDYLCCTSLLCIFPYFKGAGNVDLTNEYNGHINVTFNGTSGGLCGNGWKSTETEVACRTARQDFRCVT
jgi:hypothetical protein